MSLSVKESEKFRKYIKSSQKSKFESRIVNHIQQRPPGSWNPRTVRGAHLLDLLIDLARSRKVLIWKEEKRKEKNRRSEDDIQKHLDQILDQQHLETPSKRKNLVKKQLTSITGLESSDHQMSKNQRKERKNQKIKLKIILASVLKN